METQESKIDSNNYWGHGRNCEGAERPSGCPQTSKKRLPRITESCRP